MLLHELPTWSVQSVGAATQTRGELRACSAFLYVVDAQTGWVAAGALTPAQFHASRLWAQGSGYTVDQLAGSVTQLAQRCADQRKVAGDPDVTCLLSLAVAAMSRTKTFSEAFRRSSSVNGHWLHLCIRTPKGDPFSRPAWTASNGSDAFLPAPTVLQFAEAVLASAQATPDAAWVRMLYADGGALPGAIVPPGLVVPRSGAKPA